MKPSPRPEPIGLLVAAVRRGVRRLVEGRVAGHGLSATQFWTLVAIAEHPGLTQAELAAAVRSDEPTVSRAIRALRMRRLVQAVRPPDDRRCVEIALAPGGAAIASQLLAVATEVRQAVEAPLSPRERDATRIALLKIVAALEAGRAAGAGAAPARNRPRRSARTVRAMRAARFSERPR
jgi:DNA-binding MarR family transcriptional regulator